MGGNLRSRLDRLAEAIGAGKLWDRATMEDLAEWEVFRSSESDRWPNAPAGVKRCATAMGAVGAFIAIRDGGEDAAETRETLGIPDDADPPAVIDRLVSIGREQGLAPAEVDWLKRELEARKARVIDHGDD